MNLGEKFAYVRSFRGDLVDLLGLPFVLRRQAAEFRELVANHREVVVVFDHTVEQHHRYSDVLDAVFVRTQAYVIRAQLAIEGPK